MPTDFREKFIQNNVSKCREKKGFFNDWEKKFFASIEDQVKRGIKLNQKQFNFLKDVAEKY